ncbi:cyclin-Q-like [Tubulanus polymorphus]|uniref:cyclin-Q-like n=1 Tax=Tubulanus polymorphus TaxID=672921 RepID=UPI003DA57CBC
MDSQQTESKARLHFKTARFMFESGLKLRIRSATLATACHIYHKFFAECETMYYDPYLIGATSLYLAGRVEEDHLKLRDVVNVCFRTLHPDQPPLEIGERYWNLRESVTQCELFIMRVLKFHLVFKHPHKYLLHYLKSIYNWLEPTTTEKIPIAKTAWSILRDSYHGSVCLRYKPEHIAIAVLYQTLQSYGIEVPHDHDADLRWWEVFSDEINISIIKDIISDITDIYSLESTVNS